MKIVGFHSGLGNQVFFYLYALYLKDKFPKEKIYGYYPKDMLSSHNGLELADVFNVKLPRSTWYSNIVAFFCRLLHKLHIDSFRVEEPDDADNGVLFVGYFQNKKYYGNNINTLKFKINELSVQNENYLSDIENTESVSIHIRRGDYLKPEVQKKYGNIATDEYYTKAIERILKLVENPRFFVFSNDISWCKNNLNLKNVCFVEGNNGKDSFMDMYLMSKCKHNILANSSFSYWGAMLNNNGGKIVIYPRVWDNDKTPDIFPNQWIGL